MEIKRDKYLEDLKDRMHNGMIKVVTGIRRCGKSYLIFTIFKDYLVDEGVNRDHIIEMEFDRKENAQYRDPDVLLDYVKKSIIDSEDYYVLLDEVQMLGDFEEVLNSLLHIKNLDIYVTGSNSRFLSSDVLTEFRGRGDDVHDQHLYVCGDGGQHGPGVEPGLAEKAVEQHDGRIDQHQADHQQYFITHLLHLPRRNRCFPSVCPPADRFRNPGALQGQRRGSPQHQASRP